MKKIIVITISVILIVCFVILVYFALIHSRGMPVAIEKIERVTLEVPFLDKEIDLSKDISSEIWDSLASKEVKLMYQVMVLPWPKIVVPEIKVKAFHNQKDIYFYLEWLDDTQDWILDINKFSDACAIMFPLGKETQPTSIMMGFLGKANIWQWKASQDEEFWQEKHPQTEAYSDYYYPFEEKEIFPVAKTIPKSAANDLIAIRVGTVTPKETHNIEARGFYSEGIWRVVFKRAIKATDPEIDAVFSAIGARLPDGQGSAEGGNIEKKQLCAFAVWNGSKGDRGGRKSISDWVELVIK